MATMPRFQLELPYMRTGELDWKTLGNILSAHILGEVLCASYVDYKYGRKSRDFRADTDWQFFYEEHDVIVLRKVFSDSPIHAWMGRTVIDLPMKEVIAYLNNHQKRKEWDKYLVEIREERRISETDVILFMHLQASQCLVKQRRDFVFFERMSYVDGKYVRSAISLDLPGSPPIRGITRAELHPGTGWVLEPYEGSESRTLVSFCMNIDLKNLPALIVNRAARRQPMSLYRIRELLTKPGKQKDRLPIEGSVETFTADDIHLVDKQSLQLEDGVSGHRFYAEEQLSVHDFLRNRPSLLRRRNQSMPEDVTIQLRHPPRDRIHESKKEEKIKRSSSYGSLPSSSVGDEKELLYSQLSNNNGPHQLEKISSSKHVPINNINGSHTNHQILVDVEQEEPYSQSEHLDKTKATVEYDYQESLDSEDVRDQEGEFEDGVMTASGREDVTITDKDEGDYPNENMATFFTPDSSTRDPSPLPSQYYSPMSSRDNISTYSDENKTDFCMSVPTVTLASNSRLEHVGSSKAYSSSFQNLADVTVTDNFSEYKRGDSDHNHSKRKKEERESPH